LCSAVSKPVNVLARPNLSFEQVAGAGAQRVSVGGALTWTAAGAFVGAACAIRDCGDFSLLGSGSVLDVWRA
jgi:2-methylisocitrate lyase-like PEP mutase family enzyme